MPRLGFRFVKQVAEAIGDDPAHVSHYINGTREIPPARIGDWMKLLQLEGDEADEFFLAAHLSRVDPKVRDIIVRHEDERIEARVRIAVYEHRIGQLTTMVEALNAMRSRPPEPPVGPPPSPAPRS